MLAAAYALIAVIILILVPWSGVRGLGFSSLFGVVIPYFAAAVFFCGVLQRVLQWSRIPNPFNITTTGGQEKSLRWIRHDKLDNPFSMPQVIGRMLSEVLLFRSLFRNNALRAGGEASYVTYASAKWLWLFAILFHYALLATVFRHLRFFTAPVPLPVRLVAEIDGWLQVGIPRVMVSGLLLLCAICLLLARRIILPELRYISLLNDFFPMLLLLAIGVTGILMRYFAGVDVDAVKGLIMGLVSFRPVKIEGIGTMFYVHFFLVCMLLAYFPYSKLMHAGGIFFSPTRTMANNSRAAHHANPWNYPVNVHTYQSYEETFHDQMKAAGIPLDDDPALPPDKDQ